MSLAHLAAACVSLMPGRVLLVRILPPVVVLPAGTPLFARALAGGLPSRRGFLWGRRRSEAEWRRPAPAGPPCRRRARPVRAALKTYRKSSQGPSARWPAPVIASG